MITAGLAKYVASAAEIGIDDLVLSPATSAGALAEAARTRGARVDCIEVLPELAEQLRGDGFTVYCGDFLTLPAPDDPFYDAVVMHPPAWREAKHVRHAMDFLKPGGKLAAIMTPAINADAGVHYVWLRMGLRRHGEVEEIPGEAFADGHKRMLVVLEKG